MKWYRVIAVIVILLANLSPLLVLADSSVDVTITADPSVSTGILNFTITYISETQLDLDWAYDVGAVNAMIRSKWNGYPADIPDEHTAPTDGVLVYYGNGIAFSDTSMNFDDNLGTLYYKVWAQRADGTWFTDTETGTEESDVVTLILLFGTGLVISGWAITKRQTVVAIIASGIWLACIAYTRANPIGEMTTGDTADTAILLTLIGLMVLVPVISFRLSRREEAKEAKEDGYKQAALPKKRASMRDVSSTKTQRETGDEYYDRLHGLTHPRR